MPLAGIYKNKIMMDSRLSPAENQFAAVPILPPTRGGGYGKSSAGMRRYSTLAGLQSLPASKKPDRQTRDRATSSHFHFLAVMPAQAGIQKHDKSGERNVVPPPRGATDEPGIVPIPPAHEGRGLRKIERWNEALFHPGRAPSPARVTERASNGIPTEGRNLTMNIS